jgi:hypothetical protein
MAPIIWTAVGVRMLWSDATAMRTCGAGDDRLDIAGLGDGPVWDWICDQDFTAETDQIQIRTRTHQTQVAFDLDGDGAGGLTLILRGNLTLGQSDFAI